MLAGNDNRSDQPSRAARALSLIGSLLALSALLFFLLPHAEAYAGENSLSRRVKITKRSELRYAGPQMNEELTEEKFQLLNQKRKALIQDIKRFVNEAKDGAQKRELSMRLASLYMEDYYASLANAQRVYSEKLKAYDELSDAEKKRTPSPVIDNSEANASLKKARSIFTTMLKRRELPSRGDEILYFMASTSMDLGRHQESLAYFRRLTREFPRSKFVHEANVHLGDFYFDNARWNDAAGYYQKIVAGKYAPLVPYARYKIAWAQYNLGNHKGALSNFMWVIRHEGEDGDGSHLRLRNEAIRDIALTFVELKMLRESVEFYREVGDPHMRPGLQNMAGVYQEKGNHQAAIKIWSYLIKQSSNHPSNPDYDLSIIKSYQISGDLTRAVGHLFERLPAYSNDSSWYEINSSDPKVVAEVKTRFEEVARKMAFESHARAQKLKQKNLYHVAEQLYEKYLEHFPTTSDASRIRFYLAEILYKKGAYVEAAKHYYQVYEDPLAGKLRPDAIQYALTSLDRQLNVDRKKQGLAEINSKSNLKLKAGVEETLKLIPYSNTEIAFMKIAAEYLKQYPSAKQAPEILYTDSYLRYQHHEIEPAYEGFWGFVKRYPSHSAAYSAAHLILDILNRRKDYDKLIAAAKQFTEIKGLARPKFKAEVAAILRQAELKQVQLIEEKGDYKKAALGYIEYTKAYGQQDESLYEKALYNAAINFTKAEMPLQAVETQEKFLRRFPKSSFRKAMVLNVAKTYELLARFDKAAEYFDRFAQDYPTDPQAPTATRLAGLYYWGSNEADKAHGVMARFLSRYGNAPDAKLVERDLISLYESKGATQQLIQYYDRKRNTRGVTYAEQVRFSVKIAELQAGTSPQAANRTLQGALSVARQQASALVGSEEGKEVLAKLLFWAASGTESQFMAIRLTLPQSRLQANLQRKIAYLKQLEKEYQQVAATGNGDWGIGALFKTAAAYRHMAQSVAQAPVPTELPAAQVEEYREEVNKSIVQPFREKAMAFAEQCLDKAQDLNLLSPWTAECQSVAANLDPKRYPPIRTLYLPPLHTALIYPEKGESKIDTGKIRTYALPLYSSGMFQSDALSRTVRSDMALTLPLLRATASEDLQSVSPMGMTYEILSSVRAKALQEDRDGARPGTREAPSFAYLNLMRVTDPRRAIKLIQETIENDPKNIALHNLLALSHLERGNLSAAKVTWLSLTARGIKHAAIWNNLGVVASLEGREKDATDYFMQASLLEGPKEALANLGFIALKYHNGFEAKKHFSRALEIARNDPTSQLGLSVAQLQNREIEDAMEVLPELTKRYRNNPYARLSLAYMLMDAAKEIEVARHVLSDYMEKHSAENDPGFRRALSEARRGDGNAPGEELPDLD